VSVKLTQFDNRAQSPSAKDRRKSSGAEAGRR
jgi:hypothetical protein